MPRNSVRSQHRCASAAGAAPSRNHHHSNHHHSNPTNPTRATRMQSCAYHTHAPVHKRAQAACGKEREAAERFAMLMQPTLILSDSGQPDLGKEIAATLPNTQVRAREAAQVWRKREVKQVGS